MVALGSQSHQGGFLISASATNRPKQPNNPRKAQRQGQSQVLPCPLGGGGSAGGGGLGGRGAGALGGLGAALRLGGRLLSVPFLRLLCLHRGAVLGGRLSVRPSYKPTKDEDAGVGLSERKSKKQKVNPIAG